MKRLYEFSLSIRTRVTGMEATASVYADSADAAEAHLRKTIASPDVLKLTLIKEPAVTHLTEPL